MRKVFCFVILHLCICALHAFKEEDLDASDLFCLDKLKFDKKIVLDSYDENEFIKEGNEKMNAFYACSWEKDNLKNDDGSVNADNLKKIVALKLKKLFPGEPAYNEYLANETVKNCIAKKGSSSGDTYIKIYNCLIANIGDITAKIKPGDVKS